jgi:S1-C subfamily serine protease
MRMARAALALLFGLLVIVAAPALAAGPDEADIAALAERVGGSVVRLSMRQNGVERGNGTGFVVHEDGVLVTNHHVVDHTEGSLVAVFRDGRESPVVGWLALDPEHDLAVVRLDDRDLTPLPLGQTDDTKVGQAVMLIGSSLGLDQSVGVGIVSQRRASETDLEQFNSIHGGDLALLGPMIQHTASSAGGSSGSPIVDMQGRVIGVQHSGATGAEVFFAADVSVLATLLDETDFNATPGRIGANPWLNYAISLVFFVLLGLGWKFVPQLTRRFETRKRTRRS